MPAGSGARIAVIACGALALDVQAISRRRGWQLDVVPIPALLHNRPERIPEAVLGKLASLRNSYDRVVLAYGDCGTYGALDQLGIERLEGGSCYEVFAGELVSQAMEQQPGTYLLTDFLARTFEHTVVRELGLDRDPTLREEYFRNYTRVLWLAQRLTPANLAAAQSAAARIGLPLEVQEVGNVGLERALERLLEGAGRSRAYSSR
ncbi:MAG: DUF1638 domain-containing protein [Solirubrobacteraceae bacterium]